MSQPRWKQYKKEKAPAGGGGGMGLTPSMAEQIAQENSVSVTELAEFAEFMDVDIVKEPYLLTIVAKAMNAPLPEFWMECEDGQSGQYYYCNTQTQQTTWEHPLDLYFKNSLSMERKSYKARAKQGHRSQENTDAAGVDVTSKAHDLYLKAQLEEKDAELVRMKSEMEHSGDHEALRQLDTKKESRLLREQNSKLQQEVQNLRKQETKKEKKGWLGGLVSKSPSAKEDIAPELDQQRRVPDVDVDGESLLPSSGSTRDLPQMPPDSTRGTPSKRDLLGGSGLVVDREQLWELREGTRVLRHGLMATRQQVESLKEQITNESEKMLVQVMRQSMMIGNAGGASAAPAARLSDGGNELRNIKEMERLRQQESQLRHENEQLATELAQAELAAAEATRAASESQAAFGAAQAAPPSPGTSAQDAAELTELRKRVESGQASSKQLSDQLRAKQDHEQAVLGVLAGRGGGDLRAGVEELSAELANVQRLHDEAAGDLAAKSRAASTSDSALAGERASFDIERNALLADIKSLNGQLEDLQRQAADQAAAGGDAQRLQAEALVAAQAQARTLEGDVNTLKSQIAAAQEEKRSTADTLERMRALQAAKEEEIGRIRAALDEATHANESNRKEFEAKLSQTQGELDAQVQAKASLEEEQRTQFSQMQAREQKAAQECERMFKLVQQAHVKVQEKDKEFKAKLDSERARFTNAMQAEVDRRMEGVMAKYEEEARQRRKLFNIVQELQGNIRVYARVRPCLDAQEESLGMGIEFVGDHNDLLIENPRDKLVPKKFEFEKVFTTSSGQRDVFDAVGPLVTSVMDGYNVCIFAYGQTGSGKTYSMEGPSGDRGVYYNAVAALFATVDERAGFAEYEISVNLMEIYNEQVVDLLHLGGREASGNGLEIRRGPQGVFVPGLTDVPVGNTEEVMEVLMRGNEQRSIATTKMNEASSRSHSLLCVNITKTVRPSAENPRGERKRSQLTLVDLAGSERLSKSEAKGSAMKEAQHINKSLSALADVIAARASKAAHVPYRNSKLTSLLEDSLSGDSKTLMLVHLRPTADNISETLCTLNFATRVRSVEMKKADAREAQKVASSRGL